MKKQSDAGAVPIWSVFFFCFLCKRCTNHIIDANQTYISGFPPNRYSSCSLCRKERNLSIATMHEIFKAERPSAGTILRASFRQTVLVTPYRPLLYMTAKLCVLRMEAGTFVWCCACLYCPPPLQIKTVKSSLSTAWRGWTRNSPFIPQAGKIMDMYFQGQDIEFSFVCFVRSLHHKKCTEILDCEYLQMILEVKKKCCKEEWKM